MLDHYGMHRVVCHDITSGAVYTVTSTSVNKDKSILIYHRSFIVQRCSTTSTCFDLQEVIIRHTYLRSWALLEKPPAVQLLKSFPAFYGTRRFITMSTRALNWSLSWARSIQSIIRHTYKNSALVLELYFNMDVSRAATRTTQQQRGSLRIYIHTSIKLSTL
jgi:hypothetical protein